VRIISKICIAAIALSLSGCYLSRTTITTTDGRSYKIYGNGELLCEDSQDCKIGQRGTPNTLELEAVKNGTTVGKKTIKREITTASIVWGFYTYFSSLYLYQAYPDKVYIPIDYGNQGVSDLVRTERNTNDWNTSPYKSKGSVWDSPDEEPPVQNSIESETAPDEY